MAVLQNLYQIYKFNSDLIANHNGVINTNTLTQGEKENCIVSIGDNILFQQIRRFRSDTRNHEEIYNYVQELRTREKECKKNGDFGKVHIYHRLISRVLFVSDIINIKIIKKSEYKLFAEKGFDVNGVHYVRFLCGSGQMRRNTITFIAQYLYEPIKNILMCDLQNRFKEFNLAKFDAYFALSFSSVLWVRKPRVCVIKDFVNIIQNQHVDFITPNPATGKKYIEDRIMNIEKNCADGQGLIDPEFATLWSQDMHLSYTPCSFVVRSLYVKGNLVTFDFKAFAAENNIKTIKDKWGQEYNINDIDVLLSESQFKMHKYYNSWDDYDKYIRQYSIPWGVARYNKKDDDENVLANYQYIQSLDLTKDDIHDLITPTINWLKKVCSGDKLYTLLYMYGAKNEEATYQDVYGSAMSLASKAVVKNIEFLQDSYVQRKVYKNIIENINKAKIGKIWVKGNYAFCIMDPLAQCQSALGLKVTGLIPADNVYSNFFNERNVIGKIDLCRSPMIDMHEHNPCDLFVSDKAYKWYKYIYSGVIYSMYDTSDARQEDSDFDGDIVLQTNNEYFVKGSHKDHNIITYEKGKAPSKALTLKNFIKKDLVGLGTGVGGFSNCATVFYAMKGIFQKDTQQSQRDELTLRIKLLREIVGQEIDRIKGTAAPVLPKEWKKKVKIDQNDTDAIKAEKYRHNSLVISKKPYFFRYLYPSLNDQYKQYEANYNQLSKDLFGLKFKKLLIKENKNQEEIQLIKRYQKFSPLITSPCIMNMLCKEVESIDFEIQFDKKNVNKLPDFKDEFIYNEDTYSTIKSLYSSFCNRKQITAINRFTKYDNGIMALPQNVYDDLFFETIDKIRAHTSNVLISLNINTKEFLFYCHRISENVKNFNWSFAWEIGGDKILDLIDCGNTYVPVQVDSNELGSEYLGRYYKLIKIEENKNKMNDNVQAQANVNNDINKSSEDFIIDDTIDTAVDLLDNDVFDYLDTCNIEEIQNVDNAN